MNHLYIPTHLWYHVPMTTQTRKPLSERFWPKVKKTDGCWIWTGATTYGGYGVINSGGRNGKIIRAHRLSWILHHGPLADNIDICHTCDNPPCVNPAHLFTGTAKTNAADMLSKGRARGGAPRGEQHPQTKFTNEQILSLRTSYATGEISIRALARQYGVDKKSIQQIVRRRTWTHI